LLTLHDALLISDTVITISVITTDRHSHHYRQTQSLQSVSSLQTDTVITTDRHSHYYQCHHYRQTQSSLQTDTVITTDRHSHLYQCLSVVMKLIVMTVSVCSDD